MTRPEFVILWEPGRPQTAQKQVQRQIKGTERVLTALCAIWILGWGLVAILEPACLRCK